MRTITLVGPRGLRLVAELPSTRPERARGLRRRPRDLQRHEAMLFRRCRSIQTVGMPSPIGVVGLDRWFGVRWALVVRPNRLIRPRRNTRHILELHPGLDVRPGDRFRIEARPEGRRGEAPTALRRSRR